MTDRAAPLSVLSHQRPLRRGRQYNFINRTASLNLASSGPVTPCGATVRAGGVSTVIEGDAKPDRARSSLGV